MVEINVATCRWGGGLNGFVLEDFGCVIECDMLTVVFLVLFVDGECSVVCEALDIEEEGVEGSRYDYFCRLFGLCSDLLTGMV